MEEEGQKVIELLYVLGSQSAYSVHPASRCHRKKEEFIEDLLSKIMMTVLD